MISHSRPPQTCDSGAGGGQVSSVVTSGGHCEATRIL